MLPLPIFPATPSTPTPTAFSCLRLRPFSVAEQISAFTAIGERLSIEDLPRILLKGKRFYAWCCAWDPSYRVRLSYSFEFRGQRANPFEFRGQRANPFEFRGQRANPCEFRG